MMQAGPSCQQSEEFLFKVLVIGDIGTGKTSIIKRYVHNFFSQHYKATIGVDFALKVSNWDANTIVRLQLWDIAGQERFANMTRVYYKEASVALVVFDLTRAATFDGALKWKWDLEQKIRLPNGKPIPSVLVANKCDMATEDYGEPVWSDSDLERAANENGFAGGFRTSAKEDIGIDNAFHCLIENALRVKRSGQYELALSERDPDVKRLDENGAAIFASSSPNLYNDNKQAMKRGRKKCGGC